MKRILFLLLSSLCLFSISFAGGALVAFPGAEGFGKYSVGGRGGKVVAVTNLQDYKSTETPVEGSLRWALNQHVRTDSVDRVYVAYGGGDSLVKKAITVYTPLTVVFKVSGTIWLKEDLKVKRDSLTIAGQTAPGDGICIAGRSVLFNGATGAEMFYYGPRRTDVIVRYVRFRPGIPRDANGVPTSSFVTYGADMENYQNVILDHCTMSWANEECLATYDTKNVTVQWCMVTEGLYRAYHTKGDRSYGGVWGGQYATYHHNLIAHQNSRTARFNGSRAHDTIAVVEYRNNVIYNWGDSDAAYGAEMYDNSNTATYTDSLGGTRYQPSITKKMTSYTGKFYYPALGKAELNLINNYYKPGPITPTGAKSYRLVTMCDRYEAAFPNKEIGKVYANGNFVYGNATVSADNWKFGVQSKYYSYAAADTATNYPKMRLNSISSEVNPYLPSSLETAALAFDTVMKNVGASLPLRDGQDKRVIAEVIAGTAVGSGVLGSGKGIIDNPADIGGWPVLATGIVPTDSDNDGMPDDFEISNSLNPNDSIDGNSIAPNGYTWLEEYLNSITVTTGLIQAPYNLKANYTLANAVDLSWNDNSDLEDNYEVERAKKGTNSFVNIATLPANSVSYTDASTIDTAYVYRVRAVNASSQSAYSNEADYLVAPEIKTIALSSNKPVITWFDLSTCETEYRIYREVAGANNYQLITTLAANVVSYTDVSAVEAITYNYKVVANLNTIESWSANTANVKPIFLAPTTLAAVISANLPSLTWLDKSAIEDGYEIQRAVSGVNVYAPIDTVAANVTSFVDNTATPNVTYVYRVRALSAALQSAYSNTTTVLVPAAISDVSIPGLIVAPNPVETVLNIQSSEPMTSYQVFSINGDLVLSKEGYGLSTINMEGLSAGYYTIKLRSVSDKQSSVKILKK